MLCVLPTHAGDVCQLINLLKWINQLGGAKGHTALIVADANLPWSQAECCVMLALQSFDDVQFRTNESSVTGWIAGSNSLWSTAAKHCQKHAINGWLWLEPDCVPLCKSWLDDLHLRWSVAGSPFLAGVYPATRADCPKIMMTGIAVYPVNAIEYFQPVLEAFDVQLSRKVIDKTTPTTLIQHFWGDNTGLAPTFRPARGTAPKHAFTLNTLNPPAVLFHRSKDGTLIDLLRAKAGIELAPKFIVTLPICSKDAELLLKCLDWMVALDNQNQFECLLSYDNSVGGVLLQRLRHAAGRAFRVVHEFEYPRPPREYWPDACNFAFQSTANHIQAKHGRPWLWFEADCVPLVPNWLDTLWLEYQHCGQPIMGPVIEGVGHMNGTAIYPANFPQISPRAMCAGGLAWDTQMTYDLVGKVHDCSRLWCHRWGMVDGQLHLTTGPAPHFSSPQAVEQWIPKGAVLFHRCKDASLIDQLRARK